MVMWERLESDSQLAQGGRPNRKTMNEREFPQLTQVADLAGFVEEVQRGRPVV